MKNSTSQKPRIQEADITEPPVLFQRSGRVVTATLNRPAVLNALNHETTTALLETLGGYDNDPSVGCFLISGSSKVFAAGADISELRQESYQSMSTQNYFSDWDAFAALRTPKVAAVAGYALGGGCELAMMCDVLLASETAVFGQPEIKLGLTPGMGGSQRLTALVGRAVAMDMILTGRTLSAEEALRAGLVSRVISSSDLMAEATDVAATIASYSKHTAMVARELVHQADQAPLADGVLFERRNYYALFDTADAQEGMDAFLEKRPPRFTHPNP